MMRRENTIGAAEAGCQCLTHHSFGDCKLLAQPVSLWLLHRPMDVILVVPLCQIPKTQDVRHLKCLVVISQCRKGSACQKVVTANWSCGNGERTAARDGK